MNSTVVCTLCLILWPGAARGDSPAWMRHWDAGYTALQHNRLAESEKEYQAAVQEAAKFGPRDLRLSETLDNLATVYYAENKVALAKPLCARAWDIDAHVLGPERWPAHDLYHRAEIYRIQHQYPQAAALSKRYLAIIEKVLGRES